MAAFSHPHDRARRGARKPLFLAVMALALLASFHACSRRHVAGPGAERPYDEPRIPIVGPAWVVDGEASEIRPSPRHQDRDAPQLRERCRSQAPVVHPSANL
jgi:hypothetical protein